MKNINFKNILLICILIIFSCNDDFIDVQSKDQNSEDYFNTEADYQDALVAAYDGLQWTYVNVMLGEIASDNTLCGGESATDVIGFQEIDDMIHTPNNSNLRDIWTWMYGAVMAWPGHGARSRGPASTRARTSAPTATPAPC